MVTSVLQDLVPEFMRIGWRSTSGLPTSQLVTSLKKFMHDGLAQLLSLDHEDLFNEWEKALTQVFHKLRAFFWPEQVKTRRSSASLEMLFALVSMTRGLILLRRSVKCGWARPVLASLSVGWHLAVTAAVPNRLHIQSMLNAMFGAATAEA